MRSLFPSPDPPVAEWGDLYYDIAFVECSVIEAESYNGQILHPAGNTERKCVPAGI